MIKIKIPPKKNKRYIENFFIKKKLGFIVKESKKDRFASDKTYMPRLDDLFNLYQFVILNKRTTIFEFGSGWSSLIFSLALQELKNKFFKEVKFLRRSNPFELFILENEKKFLNKTRKRIEKFNKFLRIKDKVKINYNFSEVEMTLFNDRICTQYRKLPLCNPDFIYIDGPGQFHSKKDINGISTRHQDMMPMICDVLKFEYFYTPGTIIVCDGRKANANFLKDNFKRSWKYINDKKKDQHIFLLDDAILGKFNKLQLDFYYKKKFLTKKNILDNKLQIK